MVTPCLPCAAVRMHMHAAAPMLLRPFSYRPHTAAPMLLQLYPGTGNGPNATTCNPNVLTVGSGRSAQQPWASDVNPGRALGLNPRPLQVQGWVFVECQPQLSLRQVAG